MKRSGIVVLARLFVVGCSGDDSDNNGTAPDTVESDGVSHEESLSNDTVRDLELAETTCP